MRDPLLLFLLLFLSVSLLWLAIPGSLPLLGESWRLMGSPGLAQRTISLLTFWAVVLFLAIRLGKKGP